MLKRIFSSGHNNPGAELKAEIEASRDSAVFLGSGPVAAKSLELLASHMKLEAVITKPKPAHHRGQFPVLDIAKGLRLPIYTVANQQELSQLIEDRRFKSRAGILIDFGIIVGQDAISHFPLGIINSHFSLLPTWRGADPITFAILSGQKKTGVSLMMLVKKLDEGPILSQDTLDITPHMTTPELTEKLIQLNNDLLGESLLPFYGGQLAPWPQNPSIKPTYSRKLTKEDGVIDWNKSAEQLEREIRAFVEWPKSRARLDNQEVIITYARVVEDAGKPGKIVVKNKKMLIYCGRGTLEIDELKPAGKPAMSGQAFLAGYSQKLGISGQRLGIRAKAQNSKP